MKPTTEIAFETYIEETLIDKCRWSHVEPIKSGIEKMLCFPQKLLITSKTQANLYNKFLQMHGDDLDGKIIETLIKERAIKGTLHILRHGFKFFGKTIDMACFKPAHTLNNEIQERYQKNILSVTRQVPCHTVNNDTVDLLFPSNGLPVATCELKNPATGQNWKHAIAQYRKDRDWRMPLFAFKTGAVVHLLPTPVRVHMTTQLKGDKTFFLPFNRGSHPGEIKCGAGNPMHPSGHRTGYFWEEVLQRDIFWKLLGTSCFWKLKKKSRLDDKGLKQKITKETLIFPRYHQLDAVTKLIAASRNERTGHNYLIQHSAGSGKTNSISWLSHRLASLHTSRDEKVFDCVVVITDRKVLDRQLQDAIYQVEHAQGVVKAIDQDVFKDFDDV